MLNSIMGMTEDRTGEFEIKRMYPVGTAQRKQTEKQMSRTSEVFGQ